MTNITTIIDQESGIQYQGVEDRSSRTGTYPVIGMIAGQFRRGRFDKPMTITNENIKAQLGYDPTNPHYMAVQDVLSSGVPSVQVLRVGAVASLICQVAPPYRYGAYILLQMPSGLIGGVVIPEGGVPIGPIGGVVIPEGGIPIGPIEGSMSEEAWRLAVRDSLTITVGEEKIDTFEFYQYGPNNSSFAVRFGYEGDLLTKQVVMCAKVPMRIEKEMM